MSYIKAKKSDIGTEGFKVLPEQFDIGATKRGNIEEFNNRFGDVLKFKPSKNKQGNVNIIKSGESGNAAASGVSDGEKISANSAEGGFLGVKFLSALNEDLAMERSLSKSVLSVYM